MPKLTTHPLALAKWKFAKHRAQSKYRGIEFNFSFKEFAQTRGATNQEEAKVHIIVSFLAMLELVREGIIDVIQNNSFEDIEISKQESADVGHPQINI